VLRCKKSRRKNTHASMAAAAAATYLPVGQAPSLRQDRAWVGNPIAGLGMLNPSSVAALSRELLASKMAFQAFGSPSTVTGPSYLGPPRDHLSEAVAQLA
jgi:hypothetical protein